jgi:hypothetical protein
MIDAFLDPYAPAKSCAKCGKRLRLIAKREYGPHRIYTYVGCKCYATQSETVFIGSPRERKRT